MCKRSVHVWFLGMMCVQILLIAGCSCSVDRNCIVVKSACNKPTDDFKEVKLNIRRESFASEGFEGIRYGESLFDGDAMVVNDIGDNYLSPDKELACFEKNRHLWLYRRTTARTSLVLDEIPFWIEEIQWLEKKIILCYENGTTKEIEIN